MHCKINRGHAAATRQLHNALTGAGWLAGTDVVSIHSTHGKPGDARLAGGIGFGVHLADLLEPERALHGHRRMGATAQEQWRRCLARAQ